MATHWLPAPVSEERFSLFDFLPLLSAKNLPKSEWFLALMFSLSLVKSVPYRKALVSYLGIQRHAEG